jgi:hypothetical protein
MADAATFTGPGGVDPRISIRREVAALSTVTAGDLLFIGQGYRSKIRERTFAGTDVNGAPFAPYSNKGPFYLYTNRDSASGRTSEGRVARATASKNRHAKTGRIGIRTATGIRYESYAAAKAAHGVANVNLYGMEQHPHMLDTIMVVAGGSRVDSSMDGLNFGSEFSAFESSTPCDLLTIGFYGPEAERARGHNEGTSHLPKREFFALNSADLAWGEKAVAERMVIRAKQAA